MREFFRIYLILEEKTSHIITISNFKFTYFKVLHNIILLRIKKKVKN